MHVGRAASIDVLIPVYNAEATLVAAIRSIQEQTVGDIRLIVVNDGSTDGSGGLLRGIAAADPRLLVLETPNRGIVAALNLALEHATAPVVARHDADDLAFPDRFERQLAYLDAHPDCIAVSGNAFHIDGQGRRTGLSTFGGDARGDAMAIPAVEPYLIHPLLMMGREALVAAGGYRYVLHSEDSDLYWRLLGHGRLYALPEPIGEIMIHAGSTTGGSVHNGRIGSLYSQLGALSYLRRQAGRPDIVFPETALRDTRGLGSLDELVRYVEPQLTVQETRHLRIAVAAKLLQNATWRPYLLEAEDCAFIAREMPAMVRLLAGRHRAVIERRRAVIWLRLLRAGRLQAVKALELSRADYLRFVPIAADISAILARRLFNYGRTLVHRAGA